MLLSHNTLSHYSDLRRRLKPDKARGQIFNHLTNYECKTLSKAVKAFSLKLRKSMKDVIFQIQLFKNKLNKNNYVTLSLFKKLL